MQIEVGTGCMKEGGGSQMEEAITEDRPRGCFASCCNQRLYKYENLLIFLH